MAIPRTLSLFYFYTDSISSSSSTEGSAPIGVNATLTKVLLASDFNRVFSLLSAHRHSSDQPSSYYVVLIFSVDRKFHPAGCRRRSQGRFHGSCWAFPPRVTP